MDCWIVEDNMNNCMHIGFNPKDGPCRLTKYNTCKGEACAFYCTKADADTALRSAHARMRELPAVDQRGYAEKYYGGLVPWGKKII